MFGKNCVRQRLALVRYCKYMYRIWIGRSGFAMCGHRKYKASFGEKIWKHIYTENTMEGQDLPGVNMASVRRRLGTW